MILSFSVVSFLYLNLKSVHSFAFLESVAYRKKKKSTVVTGVEGRTVVLSHLRLRVSARM